MEPSPVEHRADVYPGQSEASPLGQAGGDQTTKKSYDVIIAGAGAVGLFIACELAIKGVTVLVLERATPDQIAPWKKGILGRRELYVPAIEAFYRRGLLHEIFNKDERPQSVPEKTKGFQFAGHFGGMMINGNNVDYSRWKDYHLPGPACVPTSSILGHIEGILTARAEALGVPVLRGKGVTSLADEGDQVKVWVGTECFEAKWLVGADGGRSTVRKAAGIPFVGTEAEFTGYAAECVLDPPDLLKPGFSRTKQGLYIKHGPTVFCVDHGTSFNRDLPVTREHFQEVVRRVSGTDVVVKELRNASSFSDRCKQAAQYRKGRVVLAGDSAHIHPPFGAQGLNTGIGDAMNLGWKLAAEAKGFAAPGLIDTYHEERYAEGKGVLDWVRAQIATLRPGPGGEAIADLLRDLNNTPDGATYSIGRIWGLSQRYDVGKEHQILGRSAPDFDIDDGTRLGTKLESGAFVYVEFEGHNAIADYSHSLEPFVKYARSSAQNSLGLKGMLLRSDGVVVCASTQDVNLDELKKALNRWIIVPDSALATHLGGSVIPSTVPSFNSGMVMPWNLPTIMGRSLDEAQAIRTFGSDAHELTAGAAAR